MIRLRQFGGTIWLSTQPTNLPRVYSVFRKGQGRIAEGNSFADPQEFKDQLNCDWDSLHHVLKK